MQREFNISLSQEFYSDVVYISQYDADYNIVFHVKNKYAAASVAGLAAKFTGIRPDGLGFEFTSTGVNSDVTFAIDNTISAVAGTGTGEIVFTDANDMVFGSANVQIIVEPAAHPNDAIDADVEEEQALADEIRGMIDEVEDTVTTVTEAKNTAVAAAGDAEDAKDAAVNAKNDAQTAKTAADADALKAEGYAVGKQNGTDVASDSDYYQNNAKYYKEQAASSATSASGSATAAAGSATAAASNTAPTYSSSSTYAVGDYCVYNSQLYRCTTAITTAEAWTAAHWTAVTVGDEISALKEDLTQTTDKVDALENAYNTAVVETATGAVCSFADGGDGLPIKSLLVDIEPVQSGSGDPAPDNVRSISGWTGANVSKTGKNLFDKNNVSYTLGYLISETGEVVENANYRCTDYIRVKPSTSYALSGKIVNSGLYNAVAFYSPDKAFISRHRPVASGANAVFTTPDNCKYIRFNAGNSTVIFDADTIQLEEGTVATAYEAFGSVIAIDWITEAGTVYGGTLDVVSGVLTVDRARVDLGTLNWTNSASGTYLSTGISTLVKVPSSNGVMANIVCEKYVISAASPITGNDGKIGIDTTGRIQCGADGTPSGHLVYELATPTTVQLTPHEVATLLGSNNVWADCGDVTVEYRADTRLFIESLTEPDADMVADSNITSGSYFMVGNTLYKATANIASGGAITPNVNCTRKSLSEALNELNA